MTLSADNKSQFPFLSTDRLRDLISQNNRLLTTISHFGISLGFGDSTVADVCRKNNVDVPTFLTVSNFLSQRPYVAADVKVAPLMEYLKGTHSYFIDFSFFKICFQYFYFCFQKYKVSRRPRI